MRPGTVHWARTLMKGVLMRSFARITVLALALALTASLAGCATGGGSAELQSDESPVPEGMPVMYEFYTES